MKNSAQLFHDDDHNVVLVDIPSSLQHAQQSTYVPISCPAITQPFPSSEPGGEKRRAILATIPAEELAYHSSLQVYIREALRLIQTDFIDGQGGSWHVRRQEHSRPNKSRRGLPNEMARASVENSYESATPQLLVPVPIILSTTEPRNEFPSQRAVSNVVVHNPGPFSSAISFTSNIDTGCLIPPRATFLCATLDAGSPSFDQGSRTLQTPNAPLFDLILMDPPWTNRSVRRSNHYHTAERQAGDPFEEAVQIVQHHAKPEGLVAIWITNKRSIHASVLNTLCALHLELIEEWVWIKVTANGVPVTQLDGIWRRPYEICLIFRHGCPPIGTGPRRRIIAAVPDVHSRKPSLKTLFELLLPPSYQALELFARSLTAGWWSWGDEVLKFQDESLWLDPSSTQ